ncbi:MAG: hypothetical protein ACI8XM_000352 [Haloarculaceae archaeon]|jgi:hypothetical protein
MTDDDFTFQLESRLTSHGIYVDEVEHAEEGYTLTYESISADNEGVVPHREVGRVINVFRDLHDDDWEGVRIEATVTDLDGESRGRWHAEQEWFDELHNGDLTEVDFSERVIETIELV